MDFLCREERQQLVKAEFWTTACCLWKMQQICPIMLAKHRIGFPGSAGINQSIGSWAKMNGKRVTTESQCPTAADGFSSSDPSNSAHSLRAIICVLGDAGKIGVMQARDPNSFVSLLMQAWCCTMLLFALTHTNTEFMSCCYGRGMRSPLLQSDGLGWVGLSTAGTVALRPAYRCCWSLANCMLLPWTVGSMVLAQKGIISCSSGEGGKVQAALICGEEEKLYKKALFYKRSKPVANVGAERQ